MKDNNHISITFTGDVLPGYLPFFIGTGYLANCYKKKLDFKLFDNKILDIFRTSDYNIINLESPVTNNIEFVNRNPFVGHSSFIQHLREIGITHACLSNNHIDEHGYGLIEETVSILKENSIGFSGINLNGTSLSYTIKKSIFNVGVVSFNQVSSKNKCNNIIKFLPTKSLQANDFFSEETNFKIAIIHWGDEYINSPSNNQQKTGRLLINSGFNLVVGHHPHVVQPFEDYNNGRIYYSLGNTLFDDLFSLNTSIGLMVRLVINHLGNIKFEHYPLFLDRDLGVRYTNNKYHIKHLQKALDISFIVDEKRYSKQQKGARTISRIRMKINLIKVLLFSSNLKDKLLIIKNILRYYGLLK